MASAGHFGLASNIKDILVPSHQLCFVVRIPDIDGFVYSQRVQTRPLKATEKRSPFSIPSVLQM